MKPEEIREFLNGHISYDRYNEWLQIYKTTKDKAVKKEMEKLIKANATGFRIRRKEAMLRDIEMERLAMTGSQLDNFGSHLRNVYKSTLNETGFKGVNKNLIDEAMKHNWAGSNYSKRVWHNNKVLAKRIDDSIPDMIEWIESFEVFPIADIIVDLIELFQKDFSSTLTMNNKKK